MDGIFRWKNGSKLILLSTVPMIFFVGKVYALSQLMTDAMDEFYFKEFMKNMKNLWEKNTDQAAGIVAGEATEEQKSKENGVSLTQI